MRVPLSTLIAALPADRRDHLFTCFARANSAVNHISRELTPLLRAEQDVLDPTDTHTWASFYTASAVHAHDIAAALTSLADSWDEISVLLARGEQPQ